MIKDCPTLYTRVWVDSEPNKRWILIGVYPVLTAMLILVIPLIAICDLLDWILTEISKPL